MTPATRREIRHALVLAGKCPRCFGQEDLIPGLHEGPRCHAERKEYRKWNYPTSPRKRDLRARYYGFLAQGKCPFCGREDLIPGLAVGPVCQTKRNQARREQRRLKGQKRRQPGDPYIRHLVRPDPPPPQSLAEAPGIWDALSLDGLELALQEAELDLAEVV